MLKILLLLSGLSVSIYLILAFSSWRGARKRGRDQPSLSYLWGLMFVVLFYYGFPLWWWRYGLGRAFKLILTCLAMVGVFQAILSYFKIIHVENFGESIAMGIFISVPIRAITGLWVARKDALWRGAAIQSRRGGQTAPSE